MSLKRRRSDSLRPMETHQDTPSSAIHESQIVNVGLHVMPNSVDELDNRVFEMPAIGMDNLCQCAIGAW